MVQMDPSQIAALQAVAKELYGDALQPAMKEAGKTLALPLRAINVVISPLALAVFSGEKVVEIVQERIESHFAKRMEDLRVPEPNIAVPAMQALVYSASIPELREMYLNLLATSMDEKAIGIAHPAYVDIVKQMTPDEARILGLYETSWEIESWQAEVNYHRKKNELGYFETGPVYKRLTLLSKDISCDSPGSVPKYLDNFLRLKLVYETKKWALHLKDIDRLTCPPMDKRHPDGLARPVGGRRFAELHSLYPELAEHISNFEDKSDYILIWSSSLRLTPFGTDFFSACLGKSLAPKPADLAETVLAEDAL